MTATAPDVIRIERLALSFAPRPWPFSERERGRIDEYFSGLRSRMPQLWNGRMLLMHEHAIENGVFRGAYLETDFASFIAWRDWGFPDPVMRNCYAQAALRGSDGGFVLGVMGERTANAGQVYFPSGTPDLNDVVGETVDLAMSAGRELQEETGLTLSDVEPEAGWFAVMAGPRIAMMKVMRSREPAAALRERILASIAAQDEPELADILVARGPQDMHPRMPDYVTAFLGHVWRA